MAVIQPVALEDALRRRSTTEPSARTLRTQELERDAESVLQAIAAEGAAFIDLGEEEENPDRYIGGLRSALARKGYQGILVQKKRNMPAAVAWKIRDEDKPRVERRQRHGAYIGQLMRDRKAKAKAVTKRGRPRRTVN